MGSEKLKKLTGKNPSDFRQVAYSLINTPDVGLFSELVDSDEYLFDFVKQNVAQRLFNECNEKNYKNLLKFLRYYSPSYEEFITSTLAEYADEDLTDTMLEIFENGTENEKTYCAKFFSYIQDSLSIEFLNKYCFSENPNLAANCAATLSEFKDKESYNIAVKKLKSQDDFERLNGVKFLVSYGDKDALGLIIQSMKSSALSENIAGELPYLIDLFSILKIDKLDGLYVLNSIINGLGEILSLGQIYDFQLYEVLKELISSPLTSSVAAVLLNAKNKFATLTENDEYLYDEPKDIKEEVYKIKDLFEFVKNNDLLTFSDGELREDSLFVYTALEFTKSNEKVRALLTSSNQTLVLKAIEILKQNNDLHESDKEIALNTVTDENIKNIITAI